MRALRQLKIIVISFSHIQSIGIAKAYRGERLVLRTQEIDFNLKLNEFRLGGNICHVFAGDLHVHIQYVKDLQWNFKGKRILSFLQYFTPKNAIRLLAFISFAGNDVSLWP
jgi:hypothetical protein